MNEPYSINWHRDKILFTPGPLTTSLSVKTAMLRDAGSWHYEFHSIVRNLISNLLEIAQVSRKDGEYDAILMQGSGTFAVEAVMASAIPPNGGLLIVSNGAYGERMIAMADTMGIQYNFLRFPENAQPDPGAIDTFLSEHPSVSHVAVVHCETTTGILNPIDEIGQIVNKHHRHYIVDAMSSFGALPIDPVASHIHYLISSPNKCLEGVPGFAFVIAHRKSLEANAGNQRSLSLNLLHQLEYFKKTSQFRYTPPTHSLLAFDQALKEFAEEGGAPARLRRYQNNHKALISGMEAIGFTPYLDPAVQSPIITSFPYPKHPNFDFNTLYKTLSDQGMLIYPGKLTETECFRIGSIGRIFEHDIRQLVQTIAFALNQMDVPHN